MLKVSTTQEQQYGKRLNEWEHSFYKKVGQGMLGQPQNTPSLSSLQC